MTLHKSRPGITTFEVHIKATYQALASEKPITFRTCDIWQSGFIGPASQREGYEFYRHHKLDEDSDEQEWQVCEIDDDEEGCMCGVFDFDGPDIKVHIREESDFVSLRPGEFCTTTYQVQTPTVTRLPKDVRVGDRFRYQFLGVTRVDWWDWGHLENEHADTVVSLPSWRGRVVEPADNGGRPNWWCLLQTLSNFELSADNGELGGGRNKLRTTQSSRREQCFARASHLMYMK